MERDVLVVVEGRDASGKTGAIRWLGKGVACRVERLAPPSHDLDRWRALFPRCGEIVVLDRSWYNRVVLEPVMGFCTRAEADRFLDEIPAFERSIAEAGIRLVKVFFDVSREEQARRLSRREVLTEIDRAAQARWNDYSAAYVHMFARTTPWIRIAADDKRSARLGLLRATLGEIG